LSEIQIVQVGDRGGGGEFLELPYSLHRASPYWVPPLRIAQKEILNTGKHPFYAHAEMRCFLARKNGEVAGRIAALIDHKFNEYHQDRAGFFGFFESVDDQEVASGLLAKAREWLMERGVRVIRGPVNPSTNYECGMLVDGFDSKPSVMMPYNPPYYPVLMDRAGLSKSKDLYAYTTHPSKVSKQKVDRIAERVMSNGVQVRPIRMNRFAEEVERVWEIYNSAWGRNWGFVPMTREEFQHEAKEMKQILKPEFVLIGEVAGRIVGFALALPDINQALQHANGKLFPLGLIKILYYQRFIRSLRVLALGVVEQYRTAGVAASFYATLIRNAFRRGMTDCELSWILEDNLLMNRSLEALGARRYKTYRIYEWN
jgi:GNAT superfamily N-acetyltransferase